MIKKKMKQPSHPSQADKEGSGSTKKKSYIARRPQVGGVSHFAEGREVLRGSGALLDQPRVVHHSRQPSRESASSVNSKHDQLKEFYRDIQQLKQQIIDYFKLNGTIK